MVSEGGGSGEVPEEVEDALEGCVANVMDDEVTSFGVDEAVDVVVGFSKLLPGVALQFG